MAVMGYVTAFTEKVLFGYVSSDALTASIDVNFITRIFQVAFIYLASLVQVYISNWYRAKEYQKIGAGVWQLIWLSLLSIGLVVPIGLWIGKIYFQKTEIANLALPYLYAYIGMNFLYPLRATLTGFYLGIGKVAWITLWTISGHIFQLILNSILILGVSGWIPSFGLMGGAMSHLIAQGILCLFLLFHFLYAKHRALFHTWHWKWQTPLFWELVKPGLFRMTTQFLQTTSWAAISYVLTQQKGISASMLAIGATIFYFLSCFSEAIQTCMMNLNAQFIGAQAYHLIKKIQKSTAILISVFFLSLSIPFFFFSEFFFHLLFPKIVLDSYQIQLIFKFIWMCLVTHAITSAKSGMILAFKDARFLIVTGIWSWLFDFGICTYMAIKVLNISSLYFWCMISMGHFVLLALYYFRIQRLQRQNLQLLKLSCPSIAEE